MQPTQRRLANAIRALAMDAVEAANSGKVAFVGDLGIYGNTVILDHGLGITAAYSHLQTVTVKAGQRVKQGQVIGSVGSTGRSTGPHLDWRVNWFDVRLDPQRLLPKE